MTSKIAVDAEADRALAVARPFFDASDCGIYFEVEHLDAACNIAIRNRVKRELGIQKVNGVMWQAVRLAKDFLPFVH